MDLFWRENLICPSEPEYIDMVNNSAFAPLPLRCGQPGSNS